MIDPRVAEHSWIGERLLELAPTEGYLPVPSGVLDAETVWGILLEREIGLAVARPDLVAVLKWSMDEDNVGGTAKPRNRSVLRRRSGSNSLPVRPPTRCWPVCGPMSGRMHCPLDSPWRWFSANRRAGSSTRQPDV